MNDESRARSTRYLLLPINKSGYMQMDQWRSTFFGSHRAESRHSARSVSQAIWWTFHEVASKAFKMSGIQHGEGDLI